MRKQLKPGVLLAILTGLNFLNYFDRFILASLIEPVKGEFQLTDAEAGSLATAFILGYFITSPFFGYLGDRMSRKWLIAGGIFAWSLATFLTGFATGYWQLIFYRVIVGLGEASYATLSPGLISDAFPASKRNNALTIFYVTIPLGAAFGTLFGSWVGANFGWHYAFIWAGAPGLLLAFVLLPFKEPERGQSDGAAAGAASHPIPGVADILGLFRIKAFSLVIAGYVAYTFALGAYQYWGQAYLQRVHGVPHEAAGTFFGGVMVVAGLFGTFAGGHIASRLQRKSPAGYATTIALSVMVATPLVFLFTFSESVLTVKLSISIAMVFLFFPTGPINTVIIESVPVNLRSSAMALSIFCIHAFGDLWSPLLVGKISDMSGSLVTGLSILPPSLIVCLYFWAMLARENRRAGRPAT